jgi:5-methylthioadenosine/S-adenosylhomocysteine deaminase
MIAPMHQSSGSSALSAASTLIVPRWIVPIEPAGVVLEGHAIAIDAAGRIAALLPVADMRALYPYAPETVLPDHVVVPGLFNLHTHAAMTLLRGLGDDLPLMDWLEKRVWPVERALLSEEFVAAGTRLACLEMLKGGTTCFSDMYFFPDAAGAAARAIGMRAHLGITVIDFPTAGGGDADDYLDRGLALFDRSRNERLLSFAFAPHAPYTISDRTFERIAMLMGQTGLPMQIHLQETQAEIEREVAEHGMRPTMRLDRLGLVGPALTAVHAVHLDAREIALFAERGVSIAHCPASNLKLASGIAPIARYLDAGINVGIGTDGTASNNRLDMPGEMRLAALLAKGASGRADAFTAHQVLHAATLAGARACGLDARIGSIVVGKDADLAAFDLGALEMNPIFDVASHLIFVAGREAVSDVWVAGNPVVQKRQFIGDGARAAEARGASDIALWQNRTSSQLPATR